MTLVLAAMTLANAMILVDQTAVPIALPDIMNGFHVGSQKVQWVLSCSLLPLAGLLVLGGKLGDLLGRRRVFLTGAILFAGGIRRRGPRAGLRAVARRARGAGRRRRAHAADLRGDRERRVPARAARPRAGDDGRGGGDRRRAGADDRRRADLRAELARRPPGQRAPGDRVRRRRGACRSPQTRRGRAACASTSAAPRSSASRSSASRSGSRRPSWRGGGRPRSSCRSSSPCSPGSRSWSTSTAWTTRSWTSRSCARTATTSAPRSARASAASPRWGSA